VIRFGAANNPFADLKNDFVFRRIFATHPDILRGLLNDLLERTGERIIEGIEYLPSEQLPLVEGAKLSILDVEGLGPARSAAARKAPAHDDEEKACQRARVAAGLTKHAFAPASAPAAAPVMDFCVAALPALRRHGFFAPPPSPRSGVMDFPRHHPARAEAPWISRATTPPAPGRHEIPETPPRSRRDAMDFLRRPLACAEMPWISCAAPSPAPRCHGLSAPAASRHAKCNKCDNRTPVRAGPRGG
jgi:hypothetical protein